MKRKNTNGSIEKIPMAPDESMSIRITIDIGNVSDVCTIHVPQDDVSYVRFMLDRAIGKVAWNRDGSMYPNEIEHTGQTFELGYGAGDGEEYSSIPGYEGVDGYHRLMSEIGCNAYLPTTFMHPVTGEKFVAVEWLGSEVDDGYQYIICQSVEGSQSF